MKRLLPALLAASLSLGPSLATAASPALAAASCPAPAFVLGFASLKNQLGPTMGDPLECEHANPQNGDSLQQTSAGLAFYRKATNTPTFTDGYHHWGLTADGLVTWDGASVDPPAAVGADVPASPSPPAPAAVPIAPQPSAPAPAPPTSPVFVTGPQPVPRAGTATDPGTCVEVGATRCLRVDPLLRGTIGVLQQTDRGPQLLRTAADGGVVVQRAAVPPQAWADFRPDGLVVTIGTSTDAFSAQDRAPVLAHELQHAYDLIQVGPAAMSTTRGCYTTEANAFGTEASVWNEIWHGRLPQPRNQLEAELNSVTQAIQTNPTAFVSQLLAVYRSECAS